MLELDLNKKIMRRVYAIWFFRRLTGAFFVETLFLVALILLMTSYVSFGNVFANFSRVFFSPVAAVWFVISAFLATELFTKVVFALILTLAIMVTRKLVLATKNGQISEFFSQFFSAIFRLVLD